MREELNLAKKIPLYPTVIIISVVVFVSIYGLRVLNPTYTDWLLAGGDLSQHYLGWVAYRRSAWHFPIGMADTLAYPYKTSVIFTDSIPIFAVLFKCLSSILPRNFQYFGLWGVMSFILQAVLSARLLKHFTESKIIIITGSIIFIFTPVMIWRMYAHTALAGQWILLLGLNGLFNHDDLNEFKKLIMFSGLLGFLTASIHIYFLLMNGIILMGILIIDFLSIKNWKRVVISLLSYILSAAFIIFLLGGFSSGMPAERGGLGVYSFNLNGFFNPQGWSTIFKDLSLYGGGQYEGFAYLGAGTIFLVVISFLSLLKNVDVEFIKKHWRKCCAIAVVCLISIIIALSQIVSLNNKVLFTVAYPKLIMNFLAIFRSTGRIVWVAVYTIEIVAFVIIIRHLDKKAIKILVVFALVLQVYDIRVILKGRFEKFENKVVYQDTMNNDKTWLAVNNQNKIKHILWTYSPNQTDEYAVTNWALNHDKTVNRFYFARDIDDEVNKNLKSKLSSVPADSVFIFSSNAKRECLKYNNLNFYQAGNFIVGYVGTLSTNTYLSLDQLYPKDTDKEFQFNQSGDTTIMGTGWSHTEPAATWSLGNNSNFILCVSKVKNYDLILKINGSCGYKNYVYVNNSNQGEIIANKDGIATIHISKNCLKKGINTFRIHTDDNVLPYNKVNKDSSDTRKLNLMVHSVCLKSIA